MVLELHIVGGDALLLHLGIQPDLVLHHLLPLLGEGAHAEVHLPEPQVPQLAAWLDIQEVKLCQTFLQTIATYTALELHITHRIVCLLSVVGGRLIPCCAT